MYSSLDINKNRVEILGTPIINISQFEGEMMGLHDILYEVFKSNIWWQVILALQVLLGIRFSVKNIWFKGFKMYPFALATRNLNPLIRRWGRSVPETIKPFVSAAAFTIGVASIVIFPLTIGIMIFTVFSPPFRSVIYATFDHWNTYSSVDFDSMLFWGAVVISIAQHELGHALIAVSNGIEVRSVGVIAVPTVLYGAYVEIDIKGFLNKDITNVEVESKQGIKCEATVLDNPKEEEREGQQKETVPDNQKQREQEEVTVYDDPELEGLRRVIARMKKKKKKVDRPSTSEYIPLLLRIEDEGKRQRMREVLGAGLLVNIIILAVSLATQLFVPTTAIAKYFVGANMLLIALNLIPLGFTDGGKLMQLVLKGRISEDVLRDITKM